MPAGEHPAALSSRFSPVGRGPFCLSAGFPGPCGHSGWMAVPLFPGRKGSFLCAAAVWIYPRCAHSPFFRPRCRKNGGWACSACTLPPKRCGCPLSPFPAFRRCAPCARRNKITAHKKRQPFLERAVFFSIILSSGPVFRQSGAAAVPGCRRNIPAFRRHFHTAFL